MFGGLIYKVYIYIIIKLKHLASMKIELKKIKVAEFMSQETTSFVADLYVDGVKAGYCHNEGTGGSTMIRVDSVDQKTLLNKAEAWAKTLPPNVSEYGTLPMDLESVVDDLLYAYLQEKEVAKFQKRLQKDMLKGIAYGTLEGGYRIVSWKMPLADVLKDPRGVEAVKKAISGIIPKLEKDESILNTNIPKELMSI